MSTIDPITPESPSNVGATSTKSSPASRAMRRASAVDVLPSFSSLSLIRKIGEMRI